MVADDGALDEVLDRLHRSEPRVQNHAPMVAEALCAMGHGDRAMAWVDGYDAPVHEMPVPRQRIEAARWRDELGLRLDAPTWELSLPRWGDWKVFFVEELAGARWQEVLDRWVARLAPGLGSAATHGVIRTAHAARALSRRETPVRRAELARGLAYWAAAYEELPARPGVAPAPDYRAALARLPLYSDRHGRSPSGSFTTGLRLVGRLDGFASARDLVAAPDDLGAELSALSSTFAGIFVERGAASPVALVHAVTGPCALRRIAPHIDPATARAAFPYAWQAAAALYCGYATRETARSGESSLAPAELAGRAVENGNDHAIKFTDALLDENQLRPDPIYLAAAQDAVFRL